MLSGHVAGSLFVLCVWQNEGEEEIWCSLFPARFLYMWFLLDGCWCIVGRHNQRRQPCVSFSTHTVVFLNGGKLLCCCLSLWFFFLPSLSLVFTISLCVLRRFHAQPHSLHLHLWHSHLFFFCFFSLCLHICLCVLFWMSTNGDRYSGLNPAERLPHAPRGFPLFT